MAFITVADTGLISYVSTRNLAERWGLGPLSWLYPLCLDAVAAVGMDLWMSNSPAKRAAAWLSLTAVTLSLAANVADWLYVSPGAAVLGAIPPLMLAALLLTMHVHVAHTERASDQPGPAVATDATEPVLSEKAVPREPRGALRATKGPRPHVPDHEVLAVLRAHEQHDEPLSRRRVMSMFSMGTDRANRLLAEARGEARAQNGSQLDLATFNQPPDAPS